MGKEYMSSSNAVIPIILVLSFLSTIGVIYGALELSDDERNAWEVLKDLLSGKISLQDIWRVLSGRDAEAKAAGACQGVDQNGVYEYDKDGKCIKLGCKLGYYEQDNMCIERRNFSDEVFSGQTSADCELDPDEPYTYSGGCKDSSGKVLTGDIDSCGNGQIEKTPNIKNVNIGSQSSCPGVEYEDCNVPCPTLCTAPDILWQPVEGAKCMEGEYELGVDTTINGVTFRYCGTGTQMKRINDELITGEMLGNMTLEEYKESIGYDTCVRNGETLKICGYTCGPGTRATECPVIEQDWGWIDEQGGKVFTTDSAKALLAGDITADQLEEEPVFTRAMARDNGALNESNETDNSKIPAGSKIQFLAKVSNFDELKEKGCSIARLVEAKAPLSNEDATWKRVPGECSEFACGLFPTQNIQYNLLEPAWGNGDSAQPTEDPQICGTRSLPCCIEGNSEHYKAGECSAEGKMTFTQNTDNCITDEQIKDTNVGALTYERDCCYQTDWSAVTGYEGCESIDGSWKRKETRTVVNPAKCGDGGDNVRFVYDDRCNYNCLIESISMTEGTKADPISDQINLTTLTKSYRKIDTVTMRQKKGDGAECTNTWDLANKKFFNTLEVKRYLNTDSYGEVERDVIIPSFSCGYTSSGGYGGSYSQGGYGCGLGNDPPMKIPNNHRDWGS
jgi:hypothetical protein